VTVALRSGLMPLVLLGLAWLAGVRIPGVFLLLAAMPVAFYTMVVAAVFDLDRGLARLLVAVSTPAVIAGVLLWRLAAG
jgi:predicted permease